MKIGARGSKLSILQAEIVADLLKKMGIEVEIKSIKTLGDKTLKPVFDINETGIFSKEINREVLEEHVDVAVHSMKDMAPELEKELEIVAILERGAVEDVLVSRWDIDSFPEHGVIGTSSMRRKMFLKHYRSDIIVEDLRGNIDTRIKKYMDKKMDGLVIAKVGLDRLGLNVEYTVLDKNIFVPQANQGALAVIARKDSKYFETLKKLDHQQTRQSCMLEREILQILQAGCQLPIGIYSWIKGDRIYLHVSEVFEESEVRKDIYLNKHVSDKTALLKEFRARW